MIADGLSLLIYGTYLFPGLGLFALWFCLTPKTQLGLRIVILLLGFVLMRDLMTPLRLWSLSGDADSFISESVCLGHTGRAVAGCRRRAGKDRSRTMKLIAWSQGNRVVGLTLGIAAGLAIGVPLRLYQGIDTAGIAGYWPWLPSMVVLAFWW
jgi:hypothetical protein